jgi:chromosome partitioning protein
MIISVLSLKGGVSKTTTALHLATVAADEGNPVVVVDADEEASASRWSTFAADAGAPLPFEVIPAERNRLAQQVRTLAEGHTVIVDTPPNNREILTRAGMLATTAIVPVVPTGLDLDRMRPTLELLRDVEASKGALDVAILLARVRTGTTLAREASEALDGFPVLDSKIRQLEAYARSFGAAPSYLDEYRGAWKELH